MRSQILTQLNRLPKTLLAAAIAGLIVAIVVLVTPNVMFERFVIAIGLPDLVAAAAPPLGVTARFAFALGSAVLVTGLIWIGLMLVLRAKSRAPSADAGNADEYFFRQLDAAPPRRRADSHPDAPPRKPIFAGDDLGTPLDLVTVVPDDEMPDDEAYGDLTPKSEPAPLEWADDEFAPAPLEERRTAEFGEAKDEAEFEPELVDTMLTVPGPFIEDEQGSCSFAEEVPAVGGEEAPAVLESDEAFEALAWPAAGARNEIGDLVARLEAGLDRRRRHLAVLRPTAEDRAEAAPEQRADAGRQDVDGALREALAALRKLNARSA